VVLRPGRRRGDRPQQGCVEGEVADGPAGDPADAAGTPTGAGQGTVTAAAGTTQALITCTASVAAVYSEGTVTGATGANAGYSRTIANLGNGSQIGLFKPFLYPIAIGDTFAVLPGCDHTTATCQNAFNNLARFGGFPYIPPPEFAV